MKRTAIVALVMLLAIDTADACHKFTIWRFPHPQNCGLTALAPHTLRFPRARINVALDPARPLVHRPIDPTPPEIPLPGLTDIDWGQPPDDEARGRILLHVILQGKNDK